MSGEYAKTMFIGEIVEVDDDQIVIKPYHIIKGEIASEDVKSETFQYYSLSEKPKKSDVVVAIIDKQDKIDTSWIFRATSKNFSELKLDCPDDPNGQNSSNMIYRYNQYINEGKYFDAADGYYVIDEITQDDIEDYILSGGLLHVEGGGFFAVAKMRLYVAWVHVKHFFKSIF